MKTELMDIPGKGICIVISDVNPNDFVFGGGKVFYGGGVFDNVMIIADEIRAHRKIGAIKEVRNQTGWGLREAKEYIDRYTGHGYGRNTVEASRCADRFIRDHMPKDFLKGDDFEL